MKKNILIALAILLIIVAGLGTVKTLQIRKLIAAGEAFVPPPETVSSAVAREEQWPDTLVAIGSIAAAQGVVLTPEVPGPVSEIAFESGAVVAKDALLVRLDTSSEEAQLRAIEAQLVLWQLNYARARQLWADKAISKTELDTAEATLKQGQANADTIRITIEKKTIRAPFAGRTGIRQVNLGEYVDKGKAIVSLQSLTPVYGDFSMPQQVIAQLQTGLKVRATADAFLNRQFAGVLTAINPDLDETTRSVRVQATFENAEQLLRPGMFARFEIVLPSEQKVVTIPDTSILSAPYGDSVYLIEPATNAAGGLVVRQQLVRVGRVRGNFISVQAGLRPGDRVVSSGVFKLRNGMSVKENNTLAPQSEPNPNPKEG
jgi:membrane fusion protein (multidrug efflux system)